MDKNKEIGLRIKNRRKELKMTQEALAYSVGYASRAMIAMIETGKVDLPSSKLDQIADALRTTVMELKGFDQELINAVTKDHIESLEGMEGIEIVRYALENCGYFDGIEWTDNMIMQVIKYAKFVSEDRD